MSPTAPALVRARVVHRRTRPFRYELAHGTTMWLVDAEAPNAAFPRWLRALATIRSRDHFAAGDDRPLPDKVRAFLDAQGLHWSTDRVLVLANARSAGFVFDPLTTYFCLDSTGRLEGVIAEVHNTYGERHCYAVETACVETHPAEGDKHAGHVAKSFYVSPFFTVEGRYDVRTRLTHDRVAVAISLTQGDETVFTASVVGDLEPATARRALAAVVRNPFPSQRVAALIRWHGVRLWLRRLPVVPRPGQAEKGTA